MQILGGIYCKDIRNRPDQDPDPGGLFNGDPCESGSETLGVGQVESMSLAGGQ